MMGEKERRVLKTLKDTALSMRAFLRKSPPLNESEQLSIENSLLMIQMEYTHWRKERYEKDGLARAPSVDRQGLISKR